MQNIFLVRLFVTVAYGRVLRNLREKTVVADNAKKMSICTEFGLNQGYPLLKGVWPYTILCLLEDGREFDTDGDWVIAEQRSVPYFSLL